MKAILFALAILSYSIDTISQKPEIKWGEEFKLRRGSTDLEVVYADKSGVYLQEGHLALKSYFVIGATARSSASLVKLDKNLSEQFRNDFNRELKGKEFEQFFMLQDKMLIIASEYQKRERSINVFAAEVNKKSGELMNEWQLVTTFQKSEKKDDIRFRIALSADSSRMIVVSSIEGREKNNYQIQEFDKSLKATKKTISISNEFDPKTYQLEDVLYLQNGRIFLVGRVYEFREGKKKKEKFLDFARYNIRMYDVAGKQLSEINTSINGKWLTSTKLVQEKQKDLVLAAFYNDNRKEKTIDGMLIQRLDPLTARVISTTEKQINHSLLSDDITDENEDDAADLDETRAERKEREKLDKIRDEGEAFSRYMKFRNIFYTSDNGLMILAEKYHHYTYTSQTYSPGSNGSPGTWRSTTYSVDECGDLLMCKISADGNIGWMQVVPKAQREVAAIGYDRGVSAYAYFDAANRPFYAGFGAIQTETGIQILFNDHPKNATVTQPGQKVKTTRRFGTSECFMLTVDARNGHVSRRPFFTNAQVPTSMPRLGSVIGEEMYIVGKEDRILGKTKIAVAKISIN